MIVLIVNSADPRLPVTPGIDPNESYLGYTLRLSGLNGYMNPAQMLSRIGKGAPSRASIMTQPTVFAKLTGRARTEFLHSAYTTRPNRHAKVRLLGHDISRAMLRSVNPRICALCVLEKKCVEAHFDLRIMVACPQHLCRLVESCAKCRRPISWERPGLLECTCGSVFCAHDHRSMPHRESEFLEIIRRKVYRIPLESSSPNGFPLAALSQMSLRSLLFLTQTLGRRVVGGKVDLVQDEGGILSNAARVFSNWPHGAMQWFENIATDVVDVESFKLSQGSLSGIYLGLRYGMRPRRDGDFVRHELSAFARRHSGYGCLDHETLSDAAMNASDYLTKREFAKEMGISIGSVRQVIKGNGIEALDLIRGGRKCLFIKRSSLPAGSGKRTRSLPEAAAMLGVTVGVLREMKRQGLYDPRFRPGINGYHDVDIHECNRRILEAAHQGSRESGANGPMVPLSHVFRFCHMPPADKVKLLTKLIAGQLAGIRVSGKQIGEILVPEGSLTEVLKKKHSVRQPKDEGRPEWNCLEVTARTGICRKVVPALIRDGYLKGTRTKHEWLVRKESVESFQRTYRSVASLATALQTSCITITRACEQSQISHISIAPSGADLRGCFIRAEDELRIREAIESIQNKSRSWFRRLDRAA